MDCNAKDDETATSKQNQQIEPFLPADVSNQNSSGTNAHLILAIAAGAFGSAFQHGFNTGVLNAPQAIIMDWIRHCDTHGSRSINSSVLDVGDEKSSVSSEECLTETTVTMIWAIVVSIYCVGGMIGGSVVGLTARKIGRKGGLLANNIFVVLGGICFFFSKIVGSVYMLIVGRLFVGINSGINAGLCTMYLSEIAPTSVRGAVGTVYQLIITISILLSQIFGMKALLGTESGWPWLLTLSVLPALIQVISLPFCPESPKYLLLERKDENGAIQSLAWLRGGQSALIHTEMNEMKQEKESEVASIGLHEMLTNAVLRRPLIIACMMMLAQQLSGINAVIFFSTSIFKEAGLNEHRAQIATLSMGGMNVAMTLISLVLVEKAGRKTLMLSGLSGMFLTTSGILICLLCAKYLELLSYVAITMVILFVVSFAVGPGSIPWFFVTELFTSAPRPTAASVAVSVNWTANFIVGLGFAPIMLAIGPYVFIIFMVLQILFLVYIWIRVPETKNKNFEEIAALFRS